MASRLELQTTLENILGSRNVYYQPPESIMMQYPAIVYERSDIYGLHADDRVYAHANRYQVTLIDEDPDSEFIEKLAELPSCRFSRHFASDNLNHDIFELYY